MSSPRLFDALRMRARSDPEAIFCWIERAGRLDVVTCGAIVAEAERIAAWLGSKRTPTGAIVAIVLEPRRELYACFIGAVFAGAVPTVLAPMTRKQDPTIFRQGMAALLARIEPTVTIVSANTAASIEANHPGLVTVDALRTFDGSQGFVEGLGAGVAFLQHSSGTTGLKKGVMLSHAAVLDQVERYAASINLSERDVVASWLPLYHDMGLITSFLMPAVKGIPVTTVDALEWSAKPTIVLDVVSKRRATLCWLPNFAFHHIARLIRPADGFDLSCLRLVVNCSEPCRDAAFSTFFAACSRFGLRRDTLQTSYALAENVFAVTQTSPGGIVRRSSHPRYPGYLSSGSAIAGTKISIRDPADGSLIADGEVGEILVASSSLFNGYHRQELATCACLHEGVLRTGDIGFLDDGELFVTGRLDDMLHVNGKNIMAHEIEEALSLVDGVMPGRVMAFPHYDQASGAGQLGIVLEPQQSGANPKLAAEVRSVVRATAGISPAEVHFVGQNFLVKNSAGKLSRAASLEKVTILARRKTDEHRPS